MELYVNQFNSSSDDVAISKVLERDANLKNILGDLNAEWIYNKDNYSQIDVESYPGNTLIEKFELFLAHYSNKNFVDSSKKCYI